MTHAMSRSLQAAMIAAVALGLGAAPGCTCRDTSSLYIDAVLSPDAPPECTVDATTAVGMAGGIWDVELTNIYLMSPRVVNALIAVGNPVDNMSGPEPNNVNLSGFNLDIQAPGGVSALSAAGSFVNVASVIAPGGVAVLSNLPVLGPDVGDDVLADLVAQGAGPGDSYTVIVTLSPVGETFGGTMLMGAEFSFPILVCRGCLLSGCGTVGPTATCTPTPDAELPCHVGQDSPVDCGLVGAAGSCCARSCP